MPAKSHAPFLVTCVALFAAWCGYVVFSFRENTRNAQNSSPAKSVLIDVREIRSSLVAALEGEEELPWIENESFAAIDEATIVTIKDELRSETLECELVTATIGDHGDVRLFCSGAPTDLDTAYNDALRFAELLSVEPEKFHEWWMRKGYAEVDPTINQNGRNDHLRSSVRIRSSLEKQQPLRVLLDVYLTCSPDDVNDIRRVLDRN